MRIKFPESIDNTLRYLKLKLLPKTLFRLPVVLVNNLSLRPKLSSLRSKLTV